MIPKTWLESWQSIPNYKGQFIPKVDLLGKRERFGSCSPHHDAFIHLLVTSPLSHTTQNIKLQWSIWVESEEERHLQHANKNTQQTVDVYILIEILWYAIFLENMYKRVCFRKAKQFHHQRRFIVPSVSPTQNRKSGLKTHHRPTSSQTRIHYYGHLWTTYWKEECLPTSSNPQKTILLYRLSKHSTSGKPRICLLRIFSNSSKSGRNLNFPRKSPWKVWTPLKQYLISIPTYTHIR